MWPMRGLGQRLVFLVLSTILLTSISATTPGNAAVITFPGARPFKLFVPSSYNKDRPAPLILALHGYSQSGNKLEKYLRLTPVVQARGILYVHPDGTADRAGNRFWNATPECCDFATKKVNDDAYLMSIINDVEKKYNVDPARIYIIGHSNGGFMANRMACDHADRIAAIVSLAGSTFSSPSACKPKAPISILQIWGTSDETYKINHILGKVIPGAVKTTASWAKLDRCAKKVASLPTKLDLERKIKGDETTVSEYRGCPVGTDVELWSIAGGKHVPAISKTFVNDVVDFLLAHPKKLKSDLPSNDSSTALSEIAILSGVSR
jgi:polyhydroxybutyrate depolymerase